MSEIKHYAPAAVVVPEPQGHPADKVDPFSMGWNAALEATTSLNRSAIPLELLRTALFGSEHEAARAANELRALLGKDE